MSKLIPNPALFVLVLVLTSCGQNEPLAEYQPKSLQEQAIKNILLDFQDGVKNRDPVKIANLIHEKASLMIDKDRKIVSKPEYVEILPKRLAEYPSIALGKPKIEVSGKKAEVKIYMTRGDSNSLVVFNIEQDHNRWLIKSWKY